MTTPIDILNARENRAFLQEKLIKKFYTPLLVIRVNYPGINKNNKTTNFISKIIYNELLTKFSLIKTNIKNIEKIDSYEGLIFLINLDLDSIKIKEIAVSVEMTHPLGRLVDLDVIDLSNHTLSRTELGFSPRRCFICNNLAHNCVRSQKHNLEEIINFIENLVRNYNS